MACFTLTPEQTQKIVDMMQVGYDGAEFDTDEDNEAIAAFMDELCSVAGPIEITVMAIEEDSHIDIGADKLDTIRKLSAGEIDIHSIPGATDALLKAGAS